MDYRKITIEDAPELAKIYAETFNSDPWMINGRKKPRKNAFPK